MVVGGVDDDLGVELPRAGSEHYVRRLPGFAIVIAQDEQHGWDATVVAVRDMTVVRIKNKDVTRGIGGDCGLPLVAGGEADSRLRGKLGWRRQSRLRQSNGNDRKQTNDEFERGGTHLWPKGWGARH